MPTGASGLASSQPLSVFLYASFLMNSMSPSSGDSPYTKTESGSLSVTFTVCLSVASRLATFRAVGRALAVPSSAPKRVSVKARSSAVASTPSCHLTPLRSRSVTWVASAETVQSSTTPVVLLSVPPGPAPMTLSNIAPL